MTRIHRATREGCPVNHGDLPCPAIIGHPLCNVWKADARLLRRLVGEHLRPEVDRGRVVLRASFLHDQRPRLLTTLHPSDFERPRRWLRGRAPDLRRAGVSMAAGSLVLRMRSGGIFNTIGFDVDYELLVVCAPTRIKAIKTVLREAIGSRPSAWPHAEPAFKTLRAKDELSVAVTEVWPIDPDVDVATTVFNERRMRDLRPIFAAAGQNATATLRQVGVTRLSNFMGLSRNGEHLVRLPAKRHKLPQPSRSAPCEAGRRRRAVIQPHAEVARPSASRW